MKSFYLLLALLPLTIAATSKCECPLAKCPGEDPAKCICQNENAIRCAKLCGKKPILKYCPKVTPSTTAKPTKTPTPTPTICGSRGLPPCAAGQTCVPNPKTPNCDPRADCPGICVVSDGSFCGGIAGLPCPLAGQTCVDNPNDDCDPKKGGADCSGVCVFIDPILPPPVSPRAAPNFAPCAGFTGRQCPRTDQKCVDDPRDSCDPKHGGADCPGICIGAACGGFAGIKCKAGQTCVDDPRDSCDPAHGGADCIGVCV